MAFFASRDKLRDKYLLTEGIIVRSYRSLLIASKKIIIFAHVLLRTKSFFAKFLSINLRNYENDGGIDFHENNEFIVVHHDRICSSCK